jgi:pimeloyl-ACP methyl ester carboxylesterase
MQDVVLLPGLLSNARLYAPQAKALAGKARFTVPDLTAFDDIAAMAGSVLDAATERFALVGFSMGGSVALTIMDRAPERVTHLALIGANHRGLSPVVEAHLSTAVEGIRAGELDQYVEHAYPLYVAPSRVDDAELKSVFLAMAHDVGPKAAVRQITALMAAPDNTAVLPKIGCPTAVVCGALDHRNPPELSREMAAAIPGATLTIIKGAAHFVTLEKPDEVTAALDAWLES